MANEFIKLFAVTVIFCVAVMTLTWRLSRRIHNMGVIDIAWSYGFAPLAVFYAVVASGDARRRWLLAAMVVIWSVRLGSHVLIRVWRLHPKEDGRYEVLREEWKRNWETKMFWFFELQAILIAVLAVPFLVVALNPRPELALLEKIGMGLWVLAVGGESLADHQLKVFKAQAANKGRVCQAGLWRYSRHPNYFFEWLVWVAFFIFALGSPWGWTVVYCPALMLFFLIKVTGIPMTEELSVRNRGEEYRAYQRTTSMFVPWFRKNGGGAPDNRR